mmetsp:Transcript_15896/g.24743  ORF Transcript_15896/g.24743 Transcript_15896/m.24743 type:complete len:85 (-) Transcript_15896:28-282(-)
MRVRATGFIACDGIGVQEEGSCFGFQDFELVVQGSGFGFGGLSAIDIPKKEFRVRAQGLGFGVDVLGLEASGLGLMVPGACRTL